MRHIAAVTGLVLTVTFSTLAVSADDARNLLLNPGAETGKRDMPSVWFAASVPAEGLRMWCDAGEAHSGQASLAISNEHLYREPVANNWSQSVQQIPRGKPVVVSAWIKTEDVDSANVCMQCWDLDGKNMLAFASTPVFRGTQDWTEVRSDPITVPYKTASIIVRAAASGTGKAWFDDVSFSVVELPSAPVAASSEPAGPAASTVDELAALVGAKVLRTGAVTRDCMVLSYLPAWNHGNVDNIAAANNDGGVRTLFAWDQSLTENDKGLRYVLAAYSRKTTSGPSPGTLEAYEILSDWPEHTSWMTQPQCSPKPVASFDFVPDSGWKLFDVTDLVRSQASDGRKAYGILLRFAAENESGRKSDWSGYAFVSREGEGQWRNFHPLLLVLEAPDAKGADPK